jgi:hypothetical protein
MRHDPVEKVKAESLCVPTAGTRVMPRHDSRIAAGASLRSQGWAYARLSSTHPTGLPNSRKWACLGPGPLMIHFFGKIY